MTLGVLGRTEVPAPTRQGWGLRTTNGWVRSKEDTDFPLTWSTQNLLKLEHTSKSLRERQVKKRGRHTTPQLSEQARAQSLFAPRRALSVLTLLPCCAERGRGGLGAARIPFVRRLWTVAPPLKPKQDLGQPEMTGSPQQHT